MNEALTTVLNAEPLVTFGLAAIGLAAIMWLLWQGIRPLVSYLGNDNMRMAMFWCSALIIAGGAGLGHFLGSYKNAASGAFGGGGIASLVVGSLILLFYGIRKWVKWCYNQPD